MKTNTITTDIINKLCASLAQGQAAFLRAGELIVQALDQGMTLEDIHEQARIPFDVAAKLERIGRKQLNPALVLADFPAVRSLVCLPLSEQNRVLAEPVEVLVFRDGVADKMTIPAASLSPKQCKQVFAKNYVRPLNEQRTYMEAKASVEKAPAKRDLPYEITRRHTVIIGGNEFTVAELLRIAAMAQDK